MSSHEDSKSVLDDTREVSGHPPYAVEGDADEQVRRQVAESYTRAVTSGGGCCGDRRQKGVAAQTAGYSVEELEAFPEDAVVNSFGCGNPLAFSDVRPGETVLDLGSGAGIDLLLASQRVGPDGLVVGVDMTEEMVAHARANVAAAGVSNVEVRQGLIEELPVADGSVDLVISNCVINLSPDKPRVFAEIARVLGPGGRMRVSDLVVQDLPQWVRENAALYSSCVAGAISEEEYVAGLQSAGLVDVAVVERLVYDEAQLRALVLSELPAAASASGGCCGGSGTLGLTGGEDEDGALDDDVAALVERAVESVGGRVASVLVTARKPGS